MDVTKFVNEIFLNVKSFTESSTCVYVASCIFTLFAILVAWKLTATNNSESKTKKQKEADESIEIKDSKICRTSNDTEQEHKIKDGKEKPTATCHPVKKEKVGTSSKKHDKKKHRGPGARTAAQPLTGGGGSTSSSGEHSSPGRENLDPLEYASHIQSRVKKVKNREMWKNVETELTADDKKKEREAQRQQLEAIFKLMETQKERFGVDNMGDVEEQVKLYM